MTQVSSQSTLTSGSETASDAQTFILPDGRTLGFAEYGNPNGTPLMYFHGFPTSRLEASPLHNMVSLRNIRLLCPDRPGFGLSSHDPRRHIMDWPQDVQVFAKHLGLSRFGILGVSGGGPYALACAQALPNEMLSAVGVMAGAGMWDKGFWTPGVPFYTRFIYLAANYWPSGMRVACNGLVGFVKWFVELTPIKKRIDRLLERKPEETTADKKEEKDEDELTPLTKTSPHLAEEAKEDEWQDRIVFPTTNRRQSLMHMIFEGFAQGTTGTVHETRLLTRDWGIDFGNIEYDQVQMWHGSKDANAPVGSIREMARRMPHCTLTEFPNDDHYQMGHHFQEVFDALVPKAAATATTDSEN